MRLLSKFKKQDEGWPMHRRPSIKINWIVFQSLMITIFFGGNEDPPSVPLKLIRKLLLIPILVSFFELNICVFRCKQSFSNIILFYLRVYLPFTSGEYPPKATSLTRKKAELYFLLLLVRILHLSIFLLSCNVFFEK